MHRDLILHHDAACFHAVHPCRNPPCQAAQSESDSFQQLRASNSFHWTQRSRRIEPPCLIHDTGGEGEGGREGERKWNERVSVHVQLSSDAPLPVVSQRRVSSNVKPGLSDCQSQRVENAASGILTAPRAGSADVCTLSTYCIVSIQWIPNTWQVWTVCTYCTDTSSDQSNDLTMPTKRRRGES